jgi:ribosomal protein S18 acetylase RimI-like enzyme
MATAEIRRIRADEWAELCALRLAALRDSPLAFGSTYERELAFTPDRWQRWAAEVATGAEHIAVAIDGRRWVAMARGSADDDDPSTAWLTAVHVAPDRRGQGVGHAVSEAVIAWARQRGFGSVRLHVAEWNDAARRLYESLRFEPTG